MHDPTRQGSSSPQKQPCCLIWPYEGGQCNRPHCDRQMRVGERERPTWCDLFPLSCSSHLNLFSSPTLILFASSPPSSRSPLFHLTPLPPYSFFTFLSLSPSPSLSLLLLQPLLLLLLASPQRHHTQAPHGTKAKGSRRRTGILWRQIQQQRSTGQLGTRTRAQQRSLSV